LTHLNLNDNSQIADFSPVSKLTDLEELCLGVNGAWDITPLSNLLKLKKLVLIGDYYPESTIGDLSSPLSNLKELEYLDLRNNLISDLSFLSRLMNLKYLDLGFNDIEDIEPLTKFPKLGKLGLAGNPIFDEFDSFDDPEHTMLLLREMRTRPNPVAIELGDTEWEIYTEEYPDDENLGNFHSLC
jgi:internalin A